MSFNDLNEEELRGLQVLIRRRARQKRVRAVLIVVIVFMVGALAGASYLTQFGERQSRIRPSDPCPNCVMAPIDGGGRVVEASGS